MREARDSTVDVLIYLCCALLCSRSYIMFHCMASLAILRQVRSKNTEDVTCLQKLMLLV